MKEQAKPTVIYNALAGGFSIGVTFSKAKAEAWLARSHATKKEIRAYPYKEPQGLTYEIDYYGLYA